MCLKCLLVQVLAERSAHFSAPAEEERVSGEAPNEEPVTPGNQDTAGATQPEYDEYTLLEMERLRADIRATDADTILKLSNAAAQLYKSNLDTSGVLRTLEQLYYPATPDVVKQRENGQTAADDLAGMPDDVRKEIESMRAAGFQVNVIRIPL